MGPRPSPLPGWEDEQSVSRTVLYKKVTKPLLERQRRARINRCLDELKELMSATLAAEGENLTKLEKADVLELTVRHLHQLHREGELSLSGSGSSLGRLQPGGQTHAANSVLESRRYQGGFLACAQQVASYVTKFPGVEPGVSQRLMAHLGNCAQQICETTTHVAPPGLPGLPFLSPPSVNLRSVTSTPLVSTSTPLAFPHLSPVNLSNPPPPSAAHFLPFNPSLCLGPPSNRTANNPPAHPTSVFDRESAFKIPSVPNPTADTAPISQSTSSKDNPINLSQTPLTIGAKRSCPGDTINAPKKRFLNTLAQQSLLASAQSANAEETEPLLTVVADVEPTPVRKTCSPNRSSEDQNNDIPRSSNVASKYNILNLSLDAESNLKSNKARVAQALNVSSSTVTVNQPPAPAAPMQAASLPVAIGSTLTITPYLHGFPLASPSPGTENNIEERSLPLDMSESEQDMWRPW